MTLATTIVGDDMPKPQYTREIPVASVASGMYIYVRFNLRRCVCRIMEEPTPHPKDYRQLLLKMEAPNGTKFERYFDQGDFMTEVLDQE